MPAGRNPIVYSRIRFLDEFLLARLSSSEPTINSHLQQSLAFLAQDRGMHTVGQVAATLNTSVRQLERKCLEFAGMTPQTMLRVSRFLHALRLKRTSNQKRSITWTEIAHASGYYDQTHLIRDFYLMGGDKPSALARQLKSHYGAALLLQPDAQQSTFRGD